MEDLASSGVESLRIGLNRAYGETELRHWFVLRLESIGYVLIAALAMLALGFLIVLGPLLFRAAMQFAPWLKELEGTFNLARFGIASVVLIVAPWNYPLLLTVGAVAAALAAGNRVIVKPSEVVVSRRRSM